MSATETHTKYSATSKELRAFCREKKREEGKERERKRKR